MREQDRSLSSLEDELRGKLHVAASIAEGRNEAVVDFSLTAVDEQIRVVEDVIDFHTKLQAQVFGETDSLVETHINVPEAGTTERVSLRHTCRERTDFREARNVRKAGRRYAAQVNVPEEVRR